VKFRAVWFSAEKLCIQINEFFKSIGTSAPFLHHTANDRFVPMAAFLKT
jgi:hypothetical protein